MTLSCVFEHGVAFFFAPYCDNKASFFFVLLLGVIYPAMHALVYRVVWPAIGESAENSNRVRVARHSRMHD